MLHRGVHFKNNELLMDIILRFNLFSPQTVMKTKKAHRIVHKMC